MRVLALDLATTLGWARADGRDAPSCGVMRLASTGRTYAHLAAEFRFWLNGTISAFEPRLIVFEAPIHLPTDQMHTLRVLYGLALIAELVAFDRCIEFGEVSVQSVRSHFLGKSFKTDFPGSDAQKRATIAECRARGWEPPDHNAADALALLDFIRTQRIEGFNSRRIGAAA